MSTIEPTGFRRDIMVLHHLSELMEKNPALPRPRVSFDKSYGKAGKNTTAIHWYLSPDYDLRGKLTSEEENTIGWDDRYTLIDQRTTELRRVNLEQRISAILDGIELLGGIEGEWEKNDPEQDSYTYQLAGRWNGANVTISCNREVVCEKVIVLETEREEEVPDPEIQEKVMQAIPRVKVMVKDTISEWQCNTALAEKTAPKYAVTTKREVAV
jgi:hypothetical protein